MTPAERAILQETARKADALHRALMEQGADGDPPLIERTAKAVKFAEGFEMFVRWVNKGVVGVAALAAAAALLWDKIRGLF